jgi:hypothetical protein
MKKILILLLSSLALVLSFPSARAAEVNTGDLFRLIAGDSILGRMTLYSIVAKRCERYLPSTDRLACQQAVLEVINQLDYDLVFTHSSEQLAENWAPRPFVMVAFKKNLIQLLSSDRTRHYLQQLKRKLNRYLLDEEPDFNLWSFTLKHYNSPLEAAKVMASLFQDTSSTKLHLSYLETTDVQGSVIFQENKHLLSKAIDTINMVLDHSEKSFLKLIYPKELKVSLNRAIYHFYVPFYLSMSLQKQTNAPGAMKAPFFLTLSYEFITASMDYRYLYSDPEKLDPIKYEWKIKDIYASYLAINMNAPDKNLQSLRSIKESFAQSTSMAVKALLK